MNQSRLFLFLFAASLSWLSQTTVGFSQTSGGEASDIFFRGYMANNAGERMEKAGDLQGAIRKYREAEEVLTSVANTFPAWETRMVAYRRGMVKDSIARVEIAIARGAGAAAPADASAGAAPQASAGSVPAPGALAGSTGFVQPSQDGDPPSLNDMLSQWETAWRKKVEALQQQNRIYEGDLSKWQQWYQWASGEIQTTRASRDQAAARVAAVEAELQRAQMAMKAGQTTQAQVDQLMQQKAAAVGQMHAAETKLKSAQQAATEASQKLAEVSAKVAGLESERDKALKERDEAMKNADEATKQAAALSAQNMGLQTQVDDLKKRGTTDEMKRLTAENERLKKELDDAQKQVVALQADVTRKDQEIASLKTELTNIQGQLTDLRKENTAYQTQISELTLQLKQVQEQMGTKPADGSAIPPELANENEVLRNIILRQLRSQARQQQAKSLVIGELQKMEGASQDLLRQVQELEDSRVTLSPEEQKLFSDPQIKELLGGSAIKATLMVQNEPATGAKPEETTENSADALVQKGNEALQAKRNDEAAGFYSDALRAEPKNASALIGQGLAYQRAGKYAEAEAALKKCLAYDPENSNAAFTLGVVLFKQEKWSDAMTWFEKCLSVDTKNSQAHHYLGIIANRLGLLQRAEKEFKTVLAIDPSFGEAHFNLAVLYITWDPPQWDKAQAEYKDALSKGVAADENLEKLLNSRVSAR
ncbi:MAG: tetratricopeptide repeat protein [Verrucomicrobiaceae bacterium]|nr:tetratricopeptide repeat protein [Verrucomicrobiaceae bacterium]